MKIGEGFIPPYGKKAHSPNRVNEIFKAFRLEDRNSFSLLDELDGSCAYPEDTLITYRAKPDKA